MNEKCPIACTFNLVIIKEDDFSIVWKDLMPKVQS